MGNTSENDNTVSEIRKWRDHLNYVLGPIGVCAAISLRNTPSTNDALLYLGTMFTFAALMLTSFNSELFLYGQKIRLEKHENYNYKTLIRYYGELFRFKNFLGYWAGIVSLLIIMIPVK